MPTFDFTSPEGKTYSVQGPEGATPEQAFQVLQTQLGSSAPAAPPPDIGENRESTIASLRGVPVLGAYADKGAAALNAALQPVMDGGLSKAGSFGERMAENEKTIKSATDAYEAAHPIGTTVGKVAMGALATAPLIAAAPEAFGVGAGSLAARTAAGAASGGALGGADAAVRGEDIAKGAGLGAVMGGAAPGVGQVVGRAVGAIANRAAPALEAPTAQAIKDAATADYQALRDSGVTVKPESVKKLAGDIRNDLQQDGFRGYLAPKAFGVLDELENGTAFTSPGAGGEVPAQVAQDVAAIRSKYGEGAASAYERQQVPAASAPEQGAPAPGAQSLLEFLASKGGLGPDSELEAIGAHGHTVNVEGIGRRKLVKQGGDTLDYAREGAMEAGYLPEGSTPRDLLNAIDAEMRGQKRYPQGFEGHVTKREAAAMGEREQADFDRHMQGFHDDLDAAGYRELAPDVRERAVKLMSSEGSDADTAVEHTLARLEQEDAAAPRSASGFPGDRPMATAPSPAPAASSRVVSFSDLHGLRRVLGKAAGSADPVERAAAVRAKARLDNYLQNLPEGDVIAGDATAAAARLKRANENYSVAKLAERLQGKVDAAELQAASANSGANLENALRQRIKDILKSDKLRRGFSVDEIAQMQRIVRGTASANVIRTLGNMLGGGGGIGTIISGGAGALAGGPAGAVVAPALGFAAKKIGARMTEAQLARLDEMIRLRAPQSEAARSVKAAREAAAQARIARAARLSTIGARVAMPAPLAVQRDRR